jgi:sugar phosphate permease
MLPYVSKRWETIWFLAMGVCINYCIRVNISIAAQKMKEDLGWTEEQKGDML